MRTMLGIGLILLALAPAVVTGTAADECKLKENLCIGQSWGELIGPIDYEDEDATGFYIMGACAVRSSDCYDQDVVWFECNGVDGLQRTTVGGKYKADCRVLT